MNESIRRVKNFKSFLVKTWKFVSWTGMGFLIVGIIVFFVPQKEFSILSVGLLLVGSILVLRSQISSRLLHVETSYLDKDFVFNEIQEYKKKITILSLIIVLSILICIILIFAQAYRSMIPSMVTIIFYIVIEYIVIGVITFRLSILQDELFKDYKR